MWLHLNNFVNMWWIWLSLGGFGEMKGEFTGLDWNLLHLVQLPTWFHSGYTFSNTLHNLAPSWLKVRRIGILFLPFIMCRSVPQSPGDRIWGVIKRLEIKYLVIKSGLSEKCTISKSSGRVNSLKPTLQIWHVIDCIHAV